MDKNKNFIEMGGCCTAQHLLRGLHGLVGLSSRRLPREGSAGTAAARSEQARARLLRAQFFLESPIFFLKLNYYYYIKF